MSDQSLASRLRLLPENRKYLGAKTTLLPWLIEQFRLKTDDDIGVFCDPMAGTGVVAYGVAALSGVRLVVAGDTLRSNVVPLRCFLSSAPSPPELLAYLQHLSDLAPSHGYVYQHFGGRYFTFDNAARIDAIREEISRCEDGALADGALTSLLYAADKVANTVGQFDAYMKNMHGPCMMNGRHLVDANVKKRLELRMPHSQSRCEALVRECDAAELLATHRCDVVYLDPPYNTRQYVDLYHVLENIARWEKPTLYGITRKFKREHLRSGFSCKARAAAELLRVSSAARCKHLFLSYNSEGVLDHETIVSILRRLGHVEIAEQEYPVFGRGAGRARKRTVIERLYYVRVS